MIQLVYNFKNKSFNELFLIFGIISNYRKQFEYDIHFMQENTNILVVLWLCQDMCILNRVPLKQVKRCLKNLRPKFDYGHAELGL